MHLVHVAKHMGRVEPIVQQLALFWGYGCN